MVFPLKTSGAFHTRFMHDAQTEFRAYLGEFTLSAPKIPVIANCSAEPYADDAVAETIATQIASPVRWSDSILHLLDLGTDEQPMEFQEIGHGNVLSRLIKTIRDKAPPRSERIAAAAAAQVAQAVQAAASPVPQADASPAKRDARVLVEDWNRRHPVGTRIRSRLIGDAVLETRTEACVLFGHRAAIYVTGYQGYFDLEEVAVVV
jgi:acyl transferase domain-containing protein